MLGFLCDFTPLFLCRAWQFYTLPCATVSGLLMGPLHSVIFVVFLKYFTLLCGVSGAMYRPCFITCQTIAWMACIIFLALSILALLWAGRQVVFGPLSFPYMTVTVGICPNSSDFIKVFLLCRPVPPPPCVKTLNMYPCQTYPQIPIPVGRIVLASRKERHS